MNHCHPIGDTAHGHDDAPLRVTINPEARVAVERTPAGLGDLVTGRWSTIGVDIINAGFVTGRFAIEASRAPGVEVRTPVTDLTGALRQRVEFGVRLLGPHPVDLTLRFWTLDSLGGLTDRNSTHLLLRVRDRRERWPIEVDALQAR